MVIVVIIAGGSGTRLWPLSTPSYPKHLLKINGDSFSLLQHTYRRAKRLTDSIYVVSEAGHIEHVKEQLPDLPEEAFITEPERRGTSNCVIAALAAITDRHPSDEPIAFTHADHYIRDIAGFTYSFRIAERLAARQHRLVLVGVEPDHPATGFGYIEKGSLLDSDSYVFNVESFKEKPNHQTAQRYLRSGNYLWNGGYFVATLATFIQSMETAAPEMARRYHVYYDAPASKKPDYYRGFTNGTIDEELIEHMKDLLVIPASFDWMDLGSFHDIAKAAVSDEKGNYIEGKVETEEVRNSFAANYEAKPMALIGLDNVVVINTADGLLVARKDLSQKVGEISKRL